MSTRNASLFVTQLKKADFHSITSWHRELEITKALKIADDDENRNDEAVALEKLGDVYNARASLEEEEESQTLFARLDRFILATALYNSSLIRSNDPSKKKELETKLRRIEENIISHCGQTIDTSEFKHDIDKKHKNKLYEFRQQCSEKLKTIQSNHKVFTSPLHDIDAESEARRTKEIRELFIQIQNFLTEAVALLLDECMKVLGQPPEGVSYAFIGLGSFARGEATPFSDLESALLIEEGKNDVSVKEYFVKIMEYFNYKVLNLQETILPSMCIPSLNDENDLINCLERFKCSSESCENNEFRDDVVEWPFLGKGKEFYDEEMRGLSVDGRMSKACKTPLGRLVQGRGQNKDLIKTPTELAELYTSALKCDQVPLEENYDLSTVLSNVSFLYGNDPELVDTYDALVLSLVHTDLRQSSAISCLRNALDQFHFSLSSSDIGLISSIKKKLYRSVGMLITNIGKFSYSSVIDNSPWNILDRLSEDGVMSGEAHRNLSVVVSIVNEVRLMAYLRCGRQDEIFSFFDQSADLNFDLVRDFCIRFFYTVFPFQKTVKKILAERELHGYTALHLPSSENFYEYSHFNSAIALSFTSYRYFNQMIEKFAQANESTTDENLKRLCLAYLSCFHPDYTSKYCEKILASIGDGNKCEWKIFAYLIAAMASFHQDDIPSIETFLNAALEAIKSEIFTPDSTTEVNVRAYSLLISSLLKYRQGNYNEALIDSDSARMLYETIMESNGSVASLFENASLFLSGSCHIMLGRHDGTGIEAAMLRAKHYTGNGDNMRILYHIYMLFFDGFENDKGLIKHVERVLELFTRFRCPKGHERWTSILAQGVVLAAMFLGLLYRNMGRVDDALRIFQLASSRLIPKALEFCLDNCHVGKIEVEKTRMYIEAFKSIFKFSEAECFHFKNCKNEMWACLTEALAILGSCRGKIRRIEQRDVFVDAFSLGRYLRTTGSFPVWHTNDYRQHAPPRFLDTLSMAPLLADWCDALTKEMQFILYTTERDITEQILLIVSQKFPNRLSQFQSNPCNMLLHWIPIIHPFADGIINEIFSGVNLQRTDVLELIRSNLSECHQYAIEFIDYWKELFFLFLRFSLCNDLLNSFGFMKT